MYWPMIFFLIYNWLVYIVDNLTIDDLKFRGAVAEDLYLNGFSIILYRLPNLAYIIIIIDNIVKQKQIYWKMFTPFCNFFHKSLQIYIEVQNVLQMIIEYESKSLKA